MNLLPKALEAVRVESLLKPTVLVLTCCTVPSWRSLVARLSHVWSPFLLMSVIPEGKHMPALSMNQQLYHSPVPLFNARTPAVMWGPTGTDPIPSLMPART